MLRTEHIEMAPEWRPLLHAQRLDSIEAVYRFAAGQVVASSGSTEVRRVELASDDGAARTIYLKKYWFSTVAQLWNGMLRGTFFRCSKVRREFDNLARLRAWGLDAPAPVACGEERAARWLTRSFLISEGVPDALPLHEFIRKILPALPSDERRARRRELIDRLAESTRRLHKRRFVHGDYFWRNIILSRQSLQKFWLIDAHKGGCWPLWAEARGRARDLAALDAPAPWFFRRTERLRFFLLYLGHRALTTEDKALLRRTLRLAAPMRERQRQRVGQ